MAPVVAERNAAEDRVVVRDRAGVGEARRVARARAETLGFGEAAVEEIALVATELASNLVKHAGEGVLRVFELGDPTGGLGIESADFGPGIDDPEGAIGDGVSTAGGLGYGLGTVHRLMDEVEITSSPEVERGTRILCKRRLRAPAPLPSRLPLSFGVASRAKPGHSPNGDSYLIKRWDEQVLVAAIDGLGHGQGAFRASQAARHYLERHHDLPMQALFAGANRACRGTRGVVVAVARLDLEAASFAYGSVGNIEGRLWNGHGLRSLPAQRGVVGLGSRPPVVQHYPWSAGSILILHSDGLSSRWGWDEYPILHEVPAMQGARILFNHLASRTDDAVVVVVKGGAE